jgi:hypothetical protein
MCSVGAGASEGVDGAVYGAFASKRPFAASSAKEGPPSPLFCRCAFGAVDPLGMLTGPIRSWREFELAAPPISQLAKQRFEALRVALLGTLRSDGSPRVSPIEPYLSQGQLLLGAMSWSLKTSDLLRDPRCVLHSAVTAPDAGEAEVKLYGRATEVSAEIREGCAAGWWQARPDAASSSPSASSRQRRSSGTWKTAGCSCAAWSPTHGLIETSRTYP